MSDQVDAPAEGAVRGDLSSMATHSRSARAIGGGGGGGGGGGTGIRAGGGVGISTGGWEAGTFFYDNHIVTANTRQFMAEIQNSHLYKLETATIENTVPDANYTYVTTPWQYFDFNCWASHFSPQDWQRVMNEYKSIKPIEMEVKIYNLQIKQIQLLGAEQDIVYNNDLTAALHVFCDGEHQYPDASQPWDEGTMPELPHAIWKLPQYAYFQTISGWAANPTFGAQVPLYFIENSSHAVLRTGEDATFSFTFSCNKLTLDKCATAPVHLKNPKVKTRRYKTAAERWPEYKKPSTNMPPPSLIGLTASQTDIKHPKGPISSMPTIKGPNYPAQGIANEVSLWDTNPISGGRQEISEERRTYYTTPNDPGVTPHVHGDDTNTDAARDRNVYYRENSSDNPPVTTSMWMMPNQYWDRAGVSRYYPIWTKKPRTDMHTIPDPGDGTIPMSHPPGTIFVKMAQIPVPGQGDSFLNIYATGQISCRIAWEAEPYITKNWRPEFRHSCEPGTINTYNIDSNGRYSVPSTFMGAMPSKICINRNI
ncbi:VP2 [Myotis myotis bocavirus 1]|nr:VP2 [Myotis myotis bocavirus 1]AFK85006.1 VP2 [Myotis myotis bocavirus 1]